MRVSFPAIHSVTGHVSVSSSCGPMQIIFHLTRLLIVYTLSRIMATRLFLSYTGYIDLKISALLKRLR